MQTNYADFFLVTIYVSYEDDRFDYSFLTVVVRQYTDSTCAMKATSDRQILLKNMPSLTHLLVGWTILKFSSD